MGEIMQSWLLIVFQGITAVGVLYGIWTNVQTRHQAVSAAREAAVHALTAVTEIQNVAAKVEEVHVATNSLAEAARAAESAAAGAAGEKRGIAIGMATAEQAAQDRDNLLKS